MLYLLQTWTSTLLVVSHDREFLNMVATDILHLNAQVIDAYKGDYESFVKTRTERIKSQKREYDAQKQYRDHIQVCLTCWCLITMFCICIVVIIFNVLCIASTLSCHSYAQQDNCALSALTCLLGCPYLFTILNI